jgi:hypothetical protein
MHTWLRSVVVKMRGRVPGKTGRLDTATRMAMDADFSGGDKPRLREAPRERARDDIHIFEVLEPSADVALFAQLVRVVNDAQDRDAEDERRLYGPTRVAGPSLRGQGRMDPGSRL